MCHFDVASSTLQWTSDPVKWPCGTLWGLRCVSALVGVPVLTNE